MRYSTPPTRKINEYTYLYEYGEEKDWEVLRYDPKSEQAVISYLRPRGFTLGDLRSEVKKKEKEISSYQPSQEDFFYEIKAQRMLGKEKVIEIRTGVELGIPAEDIWLEAMLLDSGIVKALISQQVERAKKKYRISLQIWISLLLRRVRFYLTTRAHLFSSTVSETNSSRFERNIQNLSSP